MSIGISNRPVYLVWGDWSGQKPSRQVLDGDETNNLMRYLVIFLGFFLVAVCGFTQQPLQTAAQIQEQKAPADQLPIAGAPPSFLTLLKTFETYFSAFAKLDASEFACLTPNAIKEWFGTPTLSAEDLQRMRTLRLQEHFI